MTPRGRARFALLLVSWGAACDGGTRSLGVGPAEKIIVPDAGAGGSPGMGGGSLGGSGTGGTGAGSDAGTGAAPSGAGTGPGSSSGATGGSDGATPGVGGSPGAGSAGAAGEDSNAGVGGDSGDGPPTGRGTITRLSVTSDGVPGDDSSAEGSSSGDGRFVAFYSLAENLAVPDENETWDAFLHDRETGRTVLVSADPSGRPGDYGGWVPSLSTDGSVCFASWSTTLAPNRARDWSAVYVGGPLLPSDTFLSGIVPITPADADEGSAGCTISEGGRFVAFLSSASNLIPGTTPSDPANYVFDSASGSAELVRYTLDGIVDLDRGANQGPIISADGSVLVIEVGDDTVMGPLARNVVLQRLASGETERLPVTHDGSAPDGASYVPSLSADGTRIAFISDATNLVPGDANGTSDVFIRDLSEGTLELASLSTEGAQGDAPVYDAALSGDGRWIVFFTSATNLIAGVPQEQGIYLRDLEMRVTVRVALPALEADEQYGSLSLNHDGRTLIFTSNVPNLVGDGDTLFHVYAFDFER